MAIPVTITPADIEGMVRHWLATRPNGYLGSEYGSEIKALLQNPFGAGVGNAFLAKLRSDIPLLASLPANALDLYFVDEGPDKRTLVIMVAGRPIQVG